jgi:hypothetical protein
MKHYPAAMLMLVAGLLGLAGTWVSSQDEPAEPDPTAFLLPDGFAGENGQVPEGAKPVLRGPVHEAFAQPSRVKPQPGPIVPKEPPKPIEEIPPDQKPAGENVQWIPGYWFWDEEKQEFLWVSGIWRAIPPGMEWVPGTWIRVETGWQWIPGYWKPVAQREVEVVPEPPEPPPLAEPPPPPGPDYFYVPGNWVYVGYRWYWRPGVWVAYRPGWVWVPACYYWTPYGYIFVDGYWDYPLRYRGWLFCPIWVDFAVCYRPGWFWRPCYWVPEPCLVSFMFVHTRRFCFFFGDYYDPFYARSGVISIYYYRVHRHCYDPLVGYYAFDYGRRDPNWLAQQRTLVQARMQGTAPRPPRTIEEQRKLLASAAGDPERQAKLRQLVVAGSVNRVNPKTVSVQKLDDKQLATLRKSIEETRQVQIQRAALERKLAETKPVAGKPPARIQPVAVKSTAEIKVTKPPPPPPVAAKETLKPPTTTVSPSKEPAKPGTDKPAADKPPQPGKTSEGIKPTRPSDEKTKPAPSKPESPSKKPTGSGQPEPSPRPSDKPVSPSKSPEKSPPGKPSATPGPGSTVERQPTPAPKPPSSPSPSPQPAPAPPPTSRPGSGSSTPSAPPIRAPEPRPSPARPSNPPERSAPPGSRPERSGRPESAIPTPPTRDTVIVPAPPSANGNVSRAGIVSPSQDPQRSIPVRSISSGDFVSPPSDGRPRSNLPDRIVPPATTSRTVAPNLPRVVPGTERGSPPPSRSPRRD